MLACSTLRGSAAALCRGRARLGTTAPCSTAGRQGSRWTAQGRLHRHRAAATESQAPQCSSLEELCTRLDTLLDQAFARPEAEDEAVALVAAAKQQGLLKAFDAGEQVPKRIYTIEELRLNRIEPEKLLSPKDESLNRVRNLAQGAALAGFGAFAWAVGFETSKVLGATLAVLFVLTADQVGNGGGGEALVVDTLGRLLAPNYARRVALHEAGHFLVAYLMGLLPKVYTLSALDAYLKYRALNVQAGCQFCDKGFGSEVSSGRLSSSSLDRYSCVALAGVVAESVSYGQAEGGVGDVAGLDRMFTALNFTQKKADAEVRWAVLNDAALLRAHKGLHERLATLMSSGASVGACVALIEKEIASGSSGGGSTSGDALSAAVTAVAQQKGMQ